MQHCVARMQKPILTLSSQHISINIFENRNLFQTTNGTHEVRKCSHNIANSQTRLKIHHCNNLAPLGRFHQHIIANLGTELCCKGHSQVALKMLLSLSIVQLCSLQLNHSCFHILVLLKFCYVFSSRLFSVYFTYNSYNSLKCSPGQTRYDRSPSFLLLKIVAQSEPYLGDLANFVKYLRALQFDNYFTMGCNPQLERTQLYPH